MNIDYILCRPSMPQQLDGNWLVSSSLLELLVSLKIFCCGYFCVFDASSKSSTIPMLVLVPLLEMMTQQLVEAAALEEAAAAMPPL
jgi:hypothetical protein